VSVYMSPVNAFRTAYMQLYIKKTSMPIPSESNQGLWVFNDEFCIGGLFIKHEFQMMIEQRNR
jgi:hypothetical protein